MSNNTRIPAAELAELRRLHAAAEIDHLGYKPGTLKDYVFGPDGDTFGFSVQRLHWNDGRDTNSENICPAIVATFNAFPAILARLEAAERERDELCDWRIQHKDQADCWECGGTACTENGFLDCAACNGTGWVTISARDAHQRREGAAKAITGLVVAAKLENPAATSIWIAALEKAAKRLREGGE